MNQKNFIKLKLLNKIVLFVLFLISVFTFFEIVPAAINRDFNSSSLSWLFITNDVYRLNGLIIFLVAFLSITTGIVTFSGLFFYSKNHFEIAKNVLISKDVRSFKINKINLFQSNKRKVFISISDLSSQHVNSRQLNALWVSISKEFKKENGVKDEHLKKIESFFIVDVVDKNGDSIPLHFNVHFKGVRIEFVDKNNNATLKLSSKENVLLDILSF